jgi:hypothetical protein
VAANGSYAVAGVAEGEAVTLVITCDSSVASLSGATLRFRGWLASGGDGATDAWTGTSAPVVEITSAVLKEITCKVPITVPAGCYKWELFRTNSGSEARLAFGTLDLDYR